MSQSMTRRERFLAGLLHRQPDRVPIDLGATRVSSLVVEEYDRLKAALRIIAPSPVSDRMMRSVYVDDRVAERLDVDARAVPVQGPLRTPLLELGAEGYRDCWGVERTRPPGCHYCEQRKFPLSGDITTADIARYPWPQPDDPGVVRGLREHLAHIRHSDCAAVLHLPPPFVHTSQYLRGWEDWYIDFVANPSLLEALFDAILEVNLGWAEAMLREIGRDVDVVMCSDDLGTQSGLQVSHEHYVRYIKARHARYFDLIHRMTPAPLAMHCCGSVVDIIEDLVETGVQALNPVQVTAAGMEPAQLKRRFRGRMAFWGAMDTQDVLPHGSPADVRRMVEERIEQMGEGGGYILAPCHNVQPDVPIENLLAMYEHARNYVPSYMKG